MEKLSTVEDESLKLHQRPVDLNDLAREAAKSFEAVCAGKKISLEIIGEPSVVSADAERLGQVLINLISNAVKYTPDSGHIRIMVKDEEKEGIITVEDDGIGIDQEDLPYIFERFYRTDRSRSRTTGGAGIGLSIVKAIVNAHGGTVQAQSEGKNLGSKVIVRIPKH